MTVKEQVLLLLEELKGEAISGEEIASRLGCTRASVWKAVKSLQQSGYDIDAVSNKGYTLRVSADVLAKEYIVEQIAKAGIDIEVTTMDVATSTNDLLKNYANNGKKNDCVLIAAEQTAGKGRRGRSFYSPEGTGIYLSFLLHPQVEIADAARLTTLSAVATAKAIEEVTGVAVDIKWVNDLWVRGKKVAGILTEASTSIEDGSLEYCIPGIGINLYEPAGGFPEDIKDIAGAVFEDDAKRENLRNNIVARLIINFMEYYKDFPKASYIDEYEKRCFVIGKEVQLLSPDHERLDVKLGADRSQGIVLGINEQCHLHIRYPDGVEEYLSSGEISVRL